MHRRAPLLIATLFTVVLASWGLARATTSVLPRAYTPLIRADGSLNTPPPTPVPTRTPRPTEIPVTLFTNGDFEQGAVYWQPQQFANAYITDSLTAPIVAHSGTHVLRLAPDVFGFAAALDAIDVMVPVDKPVLSYWAWVRSTESSCLNDVGGAAANTVIRIVDTISLCATNQTDGWTHRTLNVTAYAGQTISMEFSAGSLRADEPGVTHNSVLYVDDVGWQAVP